ncbi:hypothetical protein QE152_g30592 [Popillia japonica]|uniref:Uncharacterized protein n=1 Tax=Popillia japonica TaxID=7064 RepID=A0AAW1JE97_POPJA
MNQSSKTRQRLAYAQQKCSNRQLTQQQQDNGTLHLTSPMCKTKMHSIYIYTDIRNCNRTSTIKLEIYRPAEFLTSRCSAGKYGRRLNAEKDNPATP